MLRLITNNPDNTPQNIQRFFKKIEFTDSCWIWKANKSKTGYGQFSLNGVNTLAHRMAFNIYKGKINDDLVIDHLCRNRGCVNPEHLEDVTQKENICRGESGYHDNHINVNSFKTHCKSGHEYNQENTYHRPDGGRNCRECDKKLHKKRYNNE